MRLSRDDPSGHHFTHRAYGGALIRHGLSAALDRRRTTRKGQR